MNVASQAIFFEWIELLLLLSIISCTTFEFQRSCQKVPRRTRFHSVLDEFPSEESCSEKIVTDGIGSQQRKIHSSDKDRRSFIHFASLTLAGTLSSGPLTTSLHFHSYTHDEADTFGRNDSRRSVANAMGLVQFPCPEGSLSNTYHMMRAGQSILEEKNILSTNPLFLTNQDDALTTLGVTQIEDSCTEMISKDINLSLIKYSLASKCIETANIVASRMMVGRNRIVPEFTFMDPRGVGLWDGASTESAVWALDVSEAGNDGRDGRPPPNDDGTPHETLFDQAIRLRQLMSILETQYSGDSILLIFPDGTGPALLSCLIAGIPLNHVHALNFEPGELRLGVTMDSSLSLLKERMLSPRYNEMIAAGQQQLLTLRKEQLLKEAELAIKPADSINPEGTRNNPYQHVNIAENKVDYVTAGIVGSIGYMALIKRKEEDSNLGMDKNSTIAPSLLALTSSNETMEQELGMYPIPAISDSEFSDVSFFTVSNSVNIEDSSNQNVFEDIPLLSLEEKVKAADIAMEEYLNKDDGGTAWLDTLNDIINEEY